MGVALGGGGDSGGGTYGGTGVGLGSGGGGSDGSWVKTGTGISVSFGIIVAIIVGSKVGTTVGISVGATLGDGSVGKTPVASIVGSIVLMGTGVSKSKVGDVLTSPLLSPSPHAANADAASNVIPAAAFLPCLFPTSKICASLNLSIAAKYTP